LVVQFVTSEGNGVKHWNLAFILTCWWGIRWGHPFFKIFKIWHQAWYHNKIVGQIHNFWKKWNKNLKFSISTNLVMRNSMLLSVFQYFENLTPDRAITIIIVCPIRNFWSKWNKKLWRLLEVPYIIICIVYVIFNYTVPIARKYTRVQVLAGAGMGILIQGTVRLHWGRSAGTVLYVDDHFPGTK